MNRTVVEKALNEIRLTKLIEEIKRKYSLKEKQ